MISIFRKRDLFTPRHNQTTLSYQQTILQTHTGKQALTFKAAAQL